MKELILVEEFKRCVHADIKTHLDEQHAETLTEAATMADDYSLTHKRLIRKAFYLQLQGRRMVLKNLQLHQAMQMKLQNL